MASRGSVIPLFIEQIKANKPITVTDPTMTRFLMFLEEAIDMVIYAFEHGNQGDILVKLARKQSTRQMLLPSSRETN
jgi:UDP-glucose 4-epimerase